MHNFALSIDGYAAGLPILLGSGERLFDHLDGGPVGYECVELVSSPSVVHARFARIMSGVEHPPAD